MSNAFLRGKLPDFTLPAFVGKVGAHLPQWPPTLALVAALNLALDRVIPRGPLEPLLGKRFTLRVTDAGLQLDFAYARQGFRPRFDDAPADLVITARLRDFLALLLREEDPDTLFFNRRLTMVGDTDLGLLVKNTLDGVELPRLASLLPTGLLAALRQRLAQTGA